MTIIIPGIETTGDILNMVLAIFGGIALFFLSLLLYHLVQLMKDVRKITEKTGETVEMVNDLLLFPLKTIGDISEKIHSVSQNKKKKKET